MRRIPDVAIAGLAAGAIALHLLLRFGLAASSRASAAPLIAVLLIGGVPMVGRILRRLLARELGADVLAAISIAAAAVLGEYLVGAIMVLMLSGGGALEAYAAGRARSVLDALARRMPRTAHRRRDGALEDADAADVRVGDVLVVLPHELCPVDGVVVEGRGNMDESYLTGEPFRIPKTPGSAVLSGAINGDSALAVEAKRLARDSRYASIMRVMEDVESRRPALRRLGDRLAAWYAPLTLLAAGAAWAASGDALRGLSVLVVATPCPLLIAIPVAVVGAVSLAAGRGIIVRDPSALERITRCSVVILDKTGTLTFGRPALTETLPAPGFAADEALRLAAALERYSRHPLAEPLSRAAEEAGLPLPDVAEVSERPGAGLAGTVAGRAVRVTGRKELSAADAALLPPQAPGLECVLLIKERPAALFRFRDAPRPESRPFLSHLSPLHRVARVLLVSGDRESEVRWLAAEVGITEVHAGCSPEQKVAIVAEETRRASTLFVGDGINDAPALAAATVGVAIGPNSDVASEAAGAVILTASLGKLDELMHIGERMLRVALQSAVGGMALSLLGVAFAASGRLTPVEGAILQELIDLAAVLNAVRAAFPPASLTDFQASPKGL